MKLKTFVFILWAAAFLSIPALAQVGRVNGTVTDPDGKPLKDVQISIEGMEVKRNYSTKTNKDGKFIHAGVSLQGTYRVIAKKQGYQSDYAEGVKPGFGGDGASVDFVLKPGEDRPLAYELTDEEKAELVRQNEEAKKKQAALEALKASFGEGIALYEQGQYEGALGKFKEASEKDPSQAVVWAYLGQTYDKLTRYDESIASYEKAVALTPREAALYQNLGNVYASKGDTVKAKEYYEKSAQLSAVGNPKQAATTYYNLGVTYINTSQYEQAAEALRTAIEYDDTHAEAHYQLGITLIGLNDMASAVKHLKRYLELDPKGANAETAKALVEQLAQ